MENRSRSVEKKLDELLRETSKERSEKKFYSSNVEPKASADSGIQLITCEDRPVRLNDAQQLLNENKIQLLMKENAKLNDELRSMQQNEVDFENAARDVRTLLLRSEEDKKHLMNRIEKLTANGITVIQSSLFLLERVLISEIERLKRRGGTTGSTRPPSQKKSGSLEEHITGLEQDRDYWKNQVELLSQMLTCPSIVGPRSTTNKQVGSRVSSASKLGRGKAQKDERTSRIEEDLKALQETRREAKQMKYRPFAGLGLIPRSRSLPREQSVQETHVPNQIRVGRNALPPRKLKQHLSFAIIGIGKRAMRGNRFTVASVTAITGPSSVCTESFEKSLENQKLRIERDELRMLLTRFEKRIQEIQDNVQTLTKERNDLHKLYADGLSLVYFFSKAKNEIHRLHHDLYDVQNAASRRVVNQEVTARLQADLERARREIEHLSAERESLAAKYKKATEVESVDKQRHSKQMDYMEKALCEATTERDEVVSRIGQLKRRLEELQCSQVQIEQRLTERNEKLKRSTEEANGLRGELEGRQRLLEETEAKLVAARQRNSELEAVYQRAEASIEEISRRLQLEREGCERFQSELQEAACERVKMQQEMEELRKAKSQLQKNNKYLEKKYMVTVTERDEVNSNCNKLATAIKNLEQKLKTAEDEVTSWTSKFQLERSAGASLAERCSVAERRLEESEFRTQDLTNELRENQDARYQLERQVKTLADNVDRLKSNVERLREENESLKSDIDLANKDKIKLEALIEDLTASNRQLVRDRDDVTHRHTVARERIAELEAALRSLETDLKRQTEAANKEHQMVVDLQRQNEAMKQRCEDLDAELTETINKHRNVEDRFHQVELRAGQLERELRLEHDDYLQVRSRLEATEEQRDAEEASLANRKLMAQRISDLEAQLTSQLMELKEARSTLDENARVLTRKEEQLRTSQAAEQSLRSELAAAQSSLRESRRALDGGEQESARIRDELAAAMRDLQRLQVELHETTDERESLKARADSYLSELARQERLLGERARERDILAEQSRAAVEDAELWRTRWTEAEAAAATARSHSDENAAEVVRLRDALEAQKREVSQCRTALERAENQVLSLNQQVDETTEAAGLARAELEALAAEVSRLRDSLVRAEAARSAKEREAVHSRVEAEEARSKLHSTEAALLQANENAATERENARNANLLLQSAREKEHTATLEAQERMNEVIMLRERAVMAEERMDAQQRENARLYERLAETEKEASRLSCSLSTERFERERLSAELQSVPTTYRPSGFSGSSGRYTTSRLRSPRREKEEI
ncbi:Centrosomal protein [Echinococcus granulosus]|uniref:Centrosomal protein n=1 Tax=Echinococcus granulosus TaxID=6210 RepID=W6UTA5_ECHGR|nr:Centrosomal protein [Echinococcus granulosus]EUB64513.1 Centrosomal protein [Echinococcus granulosus]